MKNFLAMAAAAVVIAAGFVDASAHAQTKAVEAAPVPPRELDPAKRVAPQPSPEPALRQASEPAPAAVAQPAPAAMPRHSGPSWEEHDRGGFFLGVQGGRGWVYDSVGQDALAISAGYRWQAGSVSLLGIELSAGRLDSTTDDGRPYNKVEYKGIGFNGRFNFGAASPVYALVRTGYFDADEKGYGSADGGYVGLGLGADFTRNFNMSLVYTNYVYFNELYWSEGTLYYDASRSDTLMLGAEVRF